VLLTGVGAARLLLVAVVAFVLGAATSLGQTMLPNELRSLANSSGSWSAAAFLLAGLARRPFEGALAGGLALVALVLGYELTSALRGFGVGIGFVLTWMVTAITAGPALGVGRRWRGDADVRRRAWGVGVLPGVLIGEGVTALATVADTTYTPYWWGSIVLGTALLPGLGVGELRSTRAWMLAFASAAGVALLFALAYVVAIPLLV
jgi:hypothetical protein